jgi:hypothetical protein
MAGGRDLGSAAQARWRAVNAPHLVALVRAGARFDRGKLVERSVPAVTNTEAAQSSKIFIHKS